ncbi:kelch repeat-containing protein [Holophaga foetida]|uniref:kelch repeat-containing protein n=1 Tax=Holophaga foetida TaxID=35839 RepID=UPI000247465A|nr:kelch repeat-containing protein [Holophaga foetida]
MRTHPNAAVFARTTRTAPRLRPGFSGFLLLLAATLFLLTACGGRGSHGSTSPISNLSYATNPAIYTVGLAITPNTPSHQGTAIRNYAVTPALPTGLSLDTRTGVISGRPTAARTIGSYTVTAFSPGSSASVQLVLTVNPSVPAITTQPANQVVSVGSTATFSIGVSGTGPFTYQWQKDGSDITGATGAQYTTPAAVQSDNGATFRVVVKNAWGGQATSQEAALEVLPGSLTQVPNLGTSRYGQAAVLLADQRTLILGGRSSTGPLASAELFDPATRSFTTLSAAMSQPRVSMTATLLGDGRVLILGGWNSTGFVATAEIFDPALGTFTQAGNLIHPRALHTATLLNDGSVLIVGGTNGQPLAQAEIFTPASSSSSPTMNAPSARIFHSATLLQDGKVLLAGGWDAGSLASAEIYDPATLSFTLLPTALGERRYLHCATVLSDGSVLFTGGIGSTGTLASAERYAPATGQFTTTGNMLVARQIHAATLLKDGNVLITGGWNGSASLASFERYDLITGQFSPASGPSLGYHSHTATLQGDGKVLVVGGYCNTPLGTSILWNLD